MADEKVQKAPEKTKKNLKAPRQDPPLIMVNERLSKPDAEVTGCFSVEQALAEARRCLACKNSVCVDACPIHIDIKTFVTLVLEGDFLAAYDKISEQSPFPGICGRVCQHELYCEKACLLGGGKKTEVKKFLPVAIGALERFVADQHFKSGAVSDGNFVPPPKDAKKVALVGSGPASLICAYDLIRMGYNVTIFEALHELGGVLAYGIPPFRLPRNVIKTEVNRLKSMGVEFFTNVLIGKTITLDELFNDKGYSAVFVGTGAGLPHLMGIPGENLIGVYTANEFLTRINLMGAWRFPDEDTPIRVESRTVVVGGGNAAMDAARWSRRLGSDTTILYRRSRTELPARAEEVLHAEEEGVKFIFLAAPVRILGNDKNEVAEIECIRMELGNPDASGRRSPVAIPGSEFRIPAATIVAAIGQSPNPTLQQATPNIITDKGKIAVDENGETSYRNVYSGGDVVRGGATVILAFQDGRKAAAAINKRLKEEKDNE